MCFFLEMAVEIYLINQFKFSGALSGVIGYSGVAFLAGLISLSMLGLNAFCLVSNLYSIIFKSNLGILLQNKKQR